MVSKRSKILMINNYNLTKMDYPTFKYGSAQLKKKSKAFICCF